VSLSWPVDNFVDNLWITLDSSINILEVQIVYAEFKWVWWSCTLYSCLY